MASRKKDGKGSKRRRKVLPGNWSVYQRAGDGRWVAKFKVEETGRYKELYAQSEDEAYEKLQQALFEQKQGVLATGPKQTVGKYLTQWLEEVHKPTLRPSSYARYHGLLKNHILPALGHIQLQKLTAQQIQTFYTRKLEEGQSASSVTSMHKVIHNALANAVRWRLVTHNVSEHVTVPKESARRVQPLSIEQIQKFLQAIQGDRLEAFFILALTTGMRHGELLALHWSDFNFQEMSVSVQRNVNYLADANGVCHFVEGEPKTKRSKRKILLTRFAVDALKEQRTRQLQERLRAGDTWEERDLVFCTRVGGYLLKPTVIAHFYSLLKKAELPKVHIHDLRHGVATLLLSLGIHPRLVQEILGHENIDTTMSTYSHILPTMQAEVAEKLNTLFEGLI
ncbi:site-specific integrase [Ktedonobacter sp. SOSP1-85]|uniref:tyrosine-type recombinase/integrase n=1 Tax=Ktedonobacter sp. SOSP1-85 TaxID=2778367 RepID=UPI0019166650|nr:tyrosine-type recombinase/integrase [Ktedonobacter sp. SOSP1-85]GHO78396.1 site-specific integrase [Ktedonobacter sp. SOSP1-85]